MAALDEDYCSTVEEGCFALMKPDKDAEICPQMANPENGIAHKYYLGAHNYNCVLRWATFQ